MKLGVGSYTYAWEIGVAGHQPTSPLSAFSLLERAKELDVDVVQYCDNLPLTSLKPSELDELAFRAKELNIDVEIGARGLDDKNLFAHLQLATRFQAPFVRLVVDSESDHPTVDGVIKRLAQIVPAFRESGVKIAIENHDRFKCEDLVRIVEYLNPEHVGICLDTVNSFGALEPPAMVVETLAPYALCLHVKDFIIKRAPSNMGFIITGCAAGDGLLDFPATILQLVATKIAVSAIIELWTEEVGSLEKRIQCEVDRALRSVAYMRSILPHTV